MFLGDLRMRLHALFLGACGIFAALLIGSDDLNGIILTGVATVALFLCFFLQSDTASSWTDMGKGPTPYAFSFLTMSVASMPTDGSLWAGMFTFAVSLGLMMATSVAIYAQGACTCERINWRDVGRIYRTLGLPNIGMVLVHYLVATDRSVISGCILLAGLTWLAMKTAPQEPFIRLPAYWAQRTAS